MQKKLGELFFGLNVQTNGAESKIKNVKTELKSVGNQAEETARKTGKLSSSFLSLGTAIKAFAGYALLNFFKSSVNEASKLAESMNAVNVVFGEGSQAIHDFAKTSSSALGMARSEFNQMATTTGALLKDTGIPMQEVARITTELATRAVDMRSVFNTSFADASSAINQALRGETEAIRRYAGDVTDASLQQYLFSQGINKSVTSLSEQEKRLYRVDLIMKQTAVTAGDFANTSDSLANRQQRLNAQITEVKANIGGALIPVIETLLERVDLTSLSTQEATNKFNNFGKGLYQAINGVMAFVTSISLIISYVGDTIAGLIQLSKVGYKVFSELNKGVLSFLSGKGFKMDTASIKQEFDVFNQIVDGQQARADKKIASVGKSFSAMLSGKGFKAVQLDGVGVSGTDTGGTGGGVDNFTNKISKAKEKTDEFTNSLNEARQESIKTAQSLNEDLNKSVDEYTKSLSETLNQGELADVVVNAEQKQKEIKDKIKTEGKTPELKKELDDVKAILDAREDYEDAKAKKIEEIKTKLAEAGIDAEKVGIDNLINTRTLEEEIEEKRRVASLDEFTRLQEQQFAKLDLLTNNFIQETSLINQKIEKEKALEQGLTEFLNGQNALRQANIDAFVSQAIAKYGSVSSQLSQLLSKQSQLSAFAMPSGSIFSSKAQGSSVVNNNKNINASVNINSSLKGGMSVEEISNKLGHELNKIS